MISCTKKSKSKRRNHNISKNNMRRRSREQRKAIKDIKDHESKAYKAAQEALTSGSQYFKKEMLSESAQIRILKASAGIGICSKCRWTSGCLGMLRTACIQVSYEQGGTIKEQGSILHRTWGWGRGSPVITTITTIPTHHHASSSPFISILFFLCCCCCCCCCWLMQKNQ